MTGTALIGACAALLVAVSALAHHRRDPHRWLPHLLMAAAMLDMAAPASMSTAWVSVPAAGALGVTAAWVARRRDGHAGAAVDLAAMATLTLLMAAPGGRSPAGHMGHGHAMASATLAYQVLTVVLWIAVRVLAQARGVWRREPRVDALEQVCALVMLGSMGAMVVA